MAKGEGTPNFSNKYAAFVKQVAPDPSKFEGAVYVTGFMGESTETGCTRIYEDIALSSYIDVPNEDILHVMDATKEESSLGAVHVWFKRSAKAKAGGDDAGAGADPYADYADGPVAQEYYGAMGNDVAMKANVITRRPICDIAIRPTIIPRYCINWYTRIQPTRCVPRLCQIDVQFPRQPFAGANYEAMDADIGAAAVAAIPPTRFVQCIPTRVNCITRNTPCRTVFNCPSRLVACNTWICPPQTLDGSCPILTRRCPVTRVCPETRVCPQTLSCPTLGGCPSLAGCPSFGACPSLACGFNPDIDINVRGGMQPMGYEGYGMDDYGDYEGDAYGMEADMDDGGYEAMAAMQIPNCNLQTINGPGCLIRTRVGPACQILTVRTVCQIRTCGPRTCALITCAGPRTCSGIRTCGLITCGSPRTCGIRTCAGPQTCAQFSCFPTCSFIC